MSTWIKLVGAEKPLKGNLISLGQSKDLTTTRHLARSLPCGKGCARNASQSGRFLLRQSRFFSEEVQPGSVGITPCFRFSTHAASRLDCEVGKKMLLSRFRQTVAFCACNPLADPSNRAMTEGLIVALIANMRHGEDHSRPIWRACPRLCQPLFWLRRETIKVRAPDGAKAYQRMTSGNPISG